MNKKIIILSRVSTQQQELESQTKELVNKAYQLGYDDKHQIVIENVESAIKLSEEERIGIQRLKQHIESDSSIDCVICWEPSRLSRQQKTLYSVRDYLVERKIQLYILNPYMKLLTDDRSKIDTTASIVFSLFSTLAENEMMIKKERFMRAKSELTKQGKKSGGATIFGYMKNKEKYCVPHPLHAKIIADLFRHYLEDRDTSLYETYTYAMSMYPEIFPPLPYIKAQHKIRHFFDTNYYWEGNWCYPPIVSKEVAEKVKEKLSKARCLPRYNCKKELLGRGKLYCGHCGRMLSPAGGNMKAYICPTDKVHSLQINYDAIDWLIWEETRVLFNMNSFISSTDKTTEINNQISLKKNELSQIEQLINEQKAKEEKLIELYMNDKVTKSILDSKIENISDEKKLYETKRNNLIIEINELENTIKEIDKNRMTNDSFGDFPSLNDITNFNTKLDYVRKYIDKAIITKINDWTADEYKYGDYWYIGEYFTKTFPITNCLRIEFEYKNANYIVQRGLYIYKNLGGYKHIWRVNADETIDLIYNQKHRRQERTIIQ